MVQISLFDFQGPPEPISGEAFTLSPLDVLAFVPFGPITAGGSKLTTGILSSIARIFAPKTIAGSIAKLPAINVARTPGSVFKTTSGFIAKTTAPQTVKSVGNTIPKSSLFSKSGLNKNVAVGGIAAGSIFGTTALITQTEGGQDLASDALNLGSGISSFFTENPLVAAGLVVIGGIIVLK